MKNPAFLFYTSDFITGTLFMNNEEVGAYIRVLCMQHQKGHLTEEEIKNICKKNKIFLSVISHFKQDKKGLFYNKRLDREKDKREKYSESRAKNRKKRTEDKVDMSSTYENISKTYDAHMENENEDENINNNNIILEVPFYNYTSNIFIINLGPKIKSRINFLKTIDSSVKTVVKTYGINTIKLDIYASFTIISNIVVPFNKQEINNSFDILLTSKVINGKIPEYYGSGFKSESDIFNL